MSEVTVNLRLGAMAEPIQQQLADQNLSLHAEDIEKFQKIHNAIVLLNLHGFLSSRQRHAMGKRLLFLITRTLQTNE